MSVVNAEGAEDGYLSARNSLVERTSQHTVPIQSHDRGPRERTVAG